MILYNNNIMGVLMSVLFTDSDCELWYDQLDSLKIKNIEMPYTIDGQEYFYDLGKTTDFKDFFDKLRKGKNSITSALNSENYKDIFEPIFASGEDVLYISFSHEMSGTFNQLRSAIAELKEKYPDRKFTMFNTKCISYPAGMVAVEASRLKSQGLSDEEIVNQLKEFVKHVGCYFIVDNLMHLKRGGRLSTTAAIAGTILSLKPVLTFDGKGALKVINKVIGRKAATNMLINKIIQNALADENHEVYILDADCRHETEQMKKVILAKRPDLSVKLQTIGPVIGSHCGPNLIAIVYKAKERAIAIDDIDGCVEVL